MHFARDGVLAPNVPDKRPDTSGRSPLVEGSSGGWADYLRASLMIFSMVSSMFATYLAAPLTLYFLSM